jgi:F-type H+-transporting ATPase subunit epsilon
MFLEIITPDRKVFEGEVVSAIFPGSLGSFQVLKNHAPMISSLAKGPITYESKDGKHSVMVSGGVVEILENKIVVMAESAE